MRGEPTELVQASTDVRVLALPAVAFVWFIHEIPAFAEHFHNRVISISPIPLPLRLLS